MDIADLLNLPCDGRSDAPEISRPATIAIQSAVSWRQEPYMSDLSPNKHYVASNAILPHMTSLGRIPPTARNHNSRTPLPQPAPAPAMPERMPLQPRDCPSVGEGTSASSKQRLGEDKMQIFMPGDLRRKRDYLKEFHRREQIFSAQHQRREKDFSDYLRRRKKEFSEQQERLEHEFARSQFDLQEKFVREFGAQAPRFGDIRVGAKCKKGRSSRGIHKTGRHR